ncbi:MAG TPA: WYL domain-containing protein [Nocardioidaceae bacterium]|nr:WYL domain-containing protein [Nocardioidaceae bacterium]
MSGARDQVGRLLALVPYIQSREQVSVEQAAADFGVRPQQIVKDLNVLWFCGLPGLGMGDLIDVDMEALGGEGVIRVSNVDYLSRPLRLGSSEASALIVALRALREASDDTVRPIVDRALAKLETAAGDGAALAAQVDVHVDSVAPEVNRLRATLEDALSSGRQVRLGYYVPARDEATERTVDPLRLVQAEGNTYLEAWCRSAEGQRLFRLDRVSYAQVLDAAVTDHSDVPPRDLSAGLFQASPDDPLVTLRLQPQARWVAEYYPVESRTELAEGGLRVSLRVGDPGWLTRLMLRIGAGAEIEEPADLSAVVRRAAHAALANYV